MPRRCSVRPSRRRVRCWRWWRKMAIDAEEALHGCGRRPGMC
jgi:hypothetical protein